MVSLSLVKYVLTAALRDRLIHSFLLLIAVGLSLSLFLGGAAIVESDQFSVVFAASGLRLAGVAGLVLFIVFYLRRAFETKDVEYILSRAISRPAFLFSHALAFGLLAVFLAVVLSLALCALAPHMVGQAHFLWGLSLVAEFFIMAQAALFFAFVLSSPTAGALAVFALYVLARMIGQILGIVDSDIGQGFVFLGYIMQVVSLIVPRLDLMAQTSWLVYGDSNISVLFILAQGVIYSFLLMMAALFDLMRRQF